MIDMVDSVDHHPEEGLAMAMVEQRYSRAEDKGETASGLWRFFQWLGGGEERVFALVESERDFFTALGMVVFAMAMASGFVLTVAASDWWTTPIRRVLWVGVAWTVLILLIERLVLKSFGTSRAWNAAVTIPRVFLSLAIALVLGLPMVQLIYRPSIANQLTASQAAQAKIATTQATSFYRPMINRADGAIAAIQSHEAALRGKIAHYGFLARCEQGVAQCSQSHLLGCGPDAPYCQRDLAFERAAEAELRRAAPRDAAAIKKLRGQIANWQRAQQIEVSNRTNAIKGDTDMLARQEALGSIERTHPAVSRYVDFVLIFFVALDLVPLTMKITHLFSTGGAYEEAAAALRERDLVDVHEINETTATNLSRISEQARAEEAVHRVRIAMGRDAAIAEHNKTWRRLIDEEN
jgi:hypothetical protein